MDFEKIRFFLTLAETLNYTKASQQLFISQSMLSRHILTIEEEIGMPLFTRNSHGVALTPVGNYLREGLKTINNEYEMMLRQARVIHRGHSGELRIGFIEALGLFDLQKHLAKYEQQHRGVEIILTSARSPSDMCQEILNGSYNLGFGMRLAGMLPGLASRQISVTEVHIVMSKHHRLAKRPQGSLSLTDFRDDLFITPVDNISTAHNRLVERCISVGFMPNIVTVPDIMTVELWLEMNRGVSFLHNNSLFLGNTNLVFHKLKDINTEEPFNIYWNADQLSPQTSAFLEFLDKELPEYT